MERFAWKARVEDGKIDKYIKMHNEIWPEMLVMLDSAGIHNYSIWNIGNELFAYYECSIEIEKSIEIQSNSKVGKRWKEHMEGVLVVEKTTGKPQLLQQVFLHE